jgi:hypothetical protein
MAPARPRRSACGRPVTQRRRKVGMRIEIADVDVGRVQVVDRTSRVTTMPLARDHFSAAALECA